jgi:hypothetical protein
LAAARRLAALPPRPFAVYPSFSLRRAVAVRTIVTHGGIAMPNPTVTLDGELITGFSPALEAIVRHLCETDCHAYGDLIEWCESRNDCIVAVVCPSCDARFLIDDDDLVELKRWTDANGIAFGCGLMAAD